MPFRHTPTEERAHPPATAAPRLSGGGPAEAPRVAIISASVGAGHDGAAAELARHLTAAGFVVDRHDFLGLVPGGLGKLLSATYHRLLTVAPAGYQRIYAVTERAGRPGRAVHAMLRGSERRVLAAVAPGTRAVVSTYPGASQVLGALRRRGRLTIPAFTYLTDFSVHPLWVAPGVDVHLATHSVPAAQAHAQGAAGVIVTGPVTDPRFAPATPAESRAARERFALPARGPLALLVAGSWGVGQVRQAAAELRDSGAATPVVVCGRNRMLADQLRADGITHVHGWTNDMPGLMHACDVLVQNAGGLTSLEALACGLPVASYRCIPGHGQTNAAALDEAGLAVWIREADDLGPRLRELLDGPRGPAQREAGLALHARRPGPADVIATAAGHRPHASPSRTPRPRRRPARRRVTLMTASALTTFVLGIGIPLSQTYSQAPRELGAVAQYFDFDGAGR